MTNQEQLNKVTYIFGAGASANALPTVRPTGINSAYTVSLRELAEKLRADTTINISYRAFCDELYQDLYWLAEKGETHVTVDSYAKLCYLNEPKTLQKIKRTLSLYFTIKQFIEKKIDNRYLNFITALIDRRHQFPENVKILNWNYDFQMQLAAETFRREEFHVGLNVSQHSPPLIPYYPALGNEYNINGYDNNLELSMVHLNGIAGFYFYEQTAYILNYFLNRSLNDINSLFDKVLTDTDKKHHLLTFAFETGQGGHYQLRKRYSYAKSIIENTDYVVIIGYSFPNDNITADNEIFQNFKSGDLKGIYIQDPYPRVDEIRELFNIKESIPIRPILDTSSFYIPKQMSLSKL